METLPLNLDEIINQAILLFDFAETNARLFHDGSDSVSIRASRPVVDTCWAAKDYFLNIWNVIWLLLARMIGAPYSL